VLPLSISDLDRDKETGEYQFPDAQLMARLRAALAKHSGIPISRLLQEQENRLPQALPETTWRLVPPQPRQPSRQRTAGSQTSTAVQTRQPLPQTDGHRAHQHAQPKPMKPTPQEDRQPPAESAPPLLGQAVSAFPTMSPAEPPQPTPERTSNVQKPAALRRRHRIA
jgi:hypothetical protein